MLSDGSKRLKKTWEELAAAASMETDPEKLATIMEEIFAALEERERTLSPVPVTKSIWLRRASHRDLTCRQLIRF
jgi:hypothetical protein